MAADAALLGSPGSGDRGMRDHLVSAGDCAPTRAMAAAIASGHRRAGRGEGCVRTRLSGRLRRLRPARAVHSGRAELRDADAGRGQPGRDRSRRVLRFSGLDRRAVADPPDRSCCWWRRH